MKEMGAMKKTDKSSVAGWEKKIVWILKALLCAYAVSGILLLILAGVFYKMDLDESKVTAGIIVIYIVSTLIGGFVSGKSAGERKFLWGLAVGVLYFVLLLLVSVGIYHSLREAGSNLLTTFLMCAGGGMLGGMIS